MILNGSHNYPIYHNPTVEECQALAQHPATWDTLRVLLFDLDDQLLVASGYGNTHSSLVAFYKHHYQVRDRKSVV